MRANPLLPCSLLVLLGSCTVGPDYEPPEVEVPATFDAAEGASDEPPIDAWWRSFEDPALTACVEEAFAANLDVRASLERIRAARAMRSMEASDYWPQVNAGAGYTVDRISGNNPRFGPAVQAGVFPRDIEYFDVGFDVAWELDVFGGTRRAVEASTARLEAEECRRGVLLLSVAAEVARNYFEVLGNRERLRLLSEQVAAQEERVAILEQRQGGGLIPADRILQARAQVRRLESRRPGLEAEVRAGTYRLAVLMGRRPEAGVPELDDGRPLPTGHTAVPIGLPSELLRRRPDVYAAERQLAAANADIGVATAELFPKFFLTGSPFLQAENFGDLFTSDSSGWLFGPSVSWNLFSAGRHRARIEAAEALEREAALEYEATVNRVLEEVESSLVRYGKDAESLRYLADAAAAQDRNAAIQDLRHGQGIVERLDALESRAQALDADQARLDQEVRLLTRLVALYKALGGGWYEAESVSLAAAGSGSEAEAEEGS